jgi:hypothetical protein
MTDIRKTKFTKMEKTEYSIAVRSWRTLIDWLTSVTDEKKIRRCLAYEVQNQCRPAFLDRIRTRFNKIRAYNELKELEKITGKTISLTYL